MRVYPRLRGGSRGARIQKLRYLGLSPPTRGIPPAIPRPPPARRSIPAYAGDPQRADWVGLDLGVYPRLRGGSLPVGCRDDLPRGLSPPTRGILFHPRISRDYLRSIPAYAGDPFVHALVSPPLSVYPRLRGGSVIAMEMRRYHDGLSPPTRGIPPPPRQAASRPGSIPAYAGDPYGPSPKRRPLEVYPRLRGGSAAAAWFALFGIGLSPPTRGIPRRAPQSVLRQGSIPAYAGDPLGSAVSANRWRVYPRLRGGSYKAVSRSSPKRGLSPPTRGIPRRAALV